MEWITSGLFTKMIMYFSMMDLLYFAFLFKKKGKKHKNKKNCTGQRPFQRASYIHKIRFIISLFRNSTQSSFFGEYDEHNVRWWDVIIVLCSYFFFSFYSSQHCVAEQPRYFYAIFSPHKGTVFIMCSRFSVFHNLMHAYPF